MKNIKRMGMFLLGMITIISCLMIPTLKTHAEIATIQISYGGDTTYRFPDGRITLGEGYYTSYGSWGIEEVMFCSQALAAGPNCRTPSQWASPEEMDNSALRKVLYYGYKGPGDILTGRYGVEGAICLTNELSSIARNNGNMDPGGYSGSAVRYTEKRYYYGTTSTSDTYLRPLYDEIVSKTDPKTTVNFRAFIIKSTAGFGTSVVTGLTTKHQDLVFGYCQPKVHDIELSDTRTVKKTVWRQTNSLGKKTDQNGAVLAGAEFDIQMSENGGAWKTVGTAKSDSTGMIYPTTDAVISKTFTSGKYGASWIENYNNIRNGEKGNYHGWSQDEETCKANLRRDFITPDLDKQVADWNAIQRKFQIVEKKAPVGAIINTTPVATGSTKINTVPVKETNQTTKGISEVEISVDAIKKDSLTDDNLSGGTFEVWAGLDADHVKKVGTIEAQDGKLQGTFTLRDDEKNYTGKKVKYVLGYDTLSAENKTFYKDYPKTKEDADKISLDDAVRQKNEAQTAFEKADKYIEIREITPPTSFKVDGTGKLTGTVPAGQALKGTMHNEGTEQITFRKTDEKGTPIADAKLKLIRVSDGFVVEEWTTTKDAKVITGLTKNTKYKIIETGVPAGYITPIVREYEITTGEQGTPNKFDFVNHKITISKKDVAGDELPGASMQVLDTDGNVVDEWTSTDKPHQVLNLVEGKKYILHEDLAPLGYAVANDIEFTATDKDQHIDMVDTVTTFSKVDAGGEEVVGAKIQVIDEDGNIVDEWVSSEEKHSIQNLEIGKKYTFHEEIAPNGYIYANDFEFTVEGNENKHYTMVDTIHSVAKKDEQGNYVKGAELQLVDKETGDVVDSWTSGRSIITLSKEQTYALEKGETVTMTRDGVEYIIEPMKKAEEPSEDTGEPAEQAELPEGTETVEPVETTDGDDQGILDQIFNPTVYDQFLVRATNIETQEKSNYFVDSHGDETDHRISNAQAERGYVLQEVSTPKGYVKASDMEVIPSATEDQSTTMVDKQVKFTKEDVTGKEVEGAKIAVVDEKGKVIDEWVSGKEPHYIENLEEGKKYTLKETLTPGGYVQASAIDFEINDATVEAHYKMVDTVNRIIKVDNKKNTVKNARLAVYDKKGKKVDEWTTGQHIIDISLEDWARLKLTGGRIEISKDRLTEPMSQETKDQMKADIDNALAIAYPDLDFVPEEELEELITPEAETDTTEPTEEPVELGKEDYLKKAFEVSTMNAEEVQGYIDQATELLEKVDPQVITKNEAEDIRKELYVLVDEVIEKEDQAIADLNKTLDIVYLEENAGSQGGYTVIYLNKDGTMKYVDIDEFGDESNHRMNNLVTGEEYTIRELMAPHGYKMAPEMTFKADGKLDLKYTMIDEILLKQATGVETINPMILVGSAVGIIVILGVAYFAIKRENNK